VRPLWIAVALAAALGACGTADELTPAEGRELELARDRIVASIELNEKLRSSPAAGDRLLAKVRRIVASGALEPRQLDEFGLAALGELRLVAPSLVLVDRQEVPRRLDREALTALLDKAKTDEDAATRVPAEKEVARLDALLDGADADGQTRVPVIDTTVANYRGELAGRLRPVWPDLAAAAAD
jgi:hypothetical protein